MTPRGLACCSFASTSSVLIAITRVLRGSLIDEKMFAIDVHEWGLENLLEKQRQQRHPKIETTAPVSPADASTKA